MYICKKMIEDGLMTKVIVPFKEHETLKVQIGEYWFYISNEGYEYKSIAKIPFGSLVEKIKETLDDFYKHPETFDDEYNYYYYYLCENI